MPGILQHRISATPVEMKVILEPEPLVVYPQRFHGGHSSEVRKPFTNTNEIFP